MSINVISGFPANAGSSAAKGGSTPAESAPSQFAAMLIQQGLDSGSGLPGAERLGGLASLLNAALAGEALADEGIERSTEQDGALTDPSALAAMFGLPLSAPAERPPALAVTESSGPSTHASIAGEINSALLPREQRDISSVMQELLAGSGGQDDLLSRIARGDEAANIAAANLDGSNPSIASFASAASTSQTSQPSLPSAPSSLATPLGEPGWAEDFGQQILWMAKNDQQSAQINITPPQLGPLQITLNLSGDQATAYIASPHAEVRQAIESSLSQLREMLSSAGIQLGDANVGANLAQQQRDTSFTAANRQQSNFENAILPANDNAANTASGFVAQRGRGLVDLFA